MKDKLTCADLEKEEEGRLWNTKLCCQGCHVEQTFIDDGEAYGVSADGKPYGPSPLEEIKLKDGRTLAACHSLLGALKHSDYLS